jgi:hypothetical protein
MSTPRADLTDQELWRRLATSPAPDAAPNAGATVSDIDLAAWLEGRLSEVEAERIDRAVGQDPVLRQAALELSEVLGQPLPTPPDRLLIRARALVGFEVEQAKPRVSFFASLFGFHGVARAAMASAALVLAIAGFMMGGGLGESYAQERNGQYTTNSDTLSELSDLFSDGI